MELSNQKNSKELQAQWYRAKQEILAIKKRYDWILRQPNLWEEKAPLFVEKVIDEQIDWFNHCGNVAIIDAYAPLLYWADITKRYFQEGGFEQITQLEEIYADVWGKYVDIVNERIPFEEEKL